MGLTCFTIDRLAMTEITSVLLALLCMLGQVTGMPRYSCGVDARPHKDGICGESLIRARNNLCILLYNEYPEHFGKRSVNDIFNYPTQAFVDMNLLGDNGDVTETPVGPTDGKLFMPLLPKARSSATLMTGMKRAEDMPSIQKRGMVCDCCFNKCLPSMLARYC